VVRVPTSLGIPTSALKAGHIERVLVRSELLAISIVAAECEGIAHSLDDAAVEGEPSAKDVLEVVNGGADITGVAEATLAADVAGLLASIESTSSVSAATEIVSDGAKCIEERDSRLVVLVVITVVAIVGAVVRHVQPIFMFAEGSSTIGVLVEGDIADGRRLDSDIASYDWGSLNGSESRQDSEEGDSAHGQLSC
jgi:hypothetical protein